MKKRLVRCHTAFAEAAGVYNYKVYFTVSEGFGYLALASWSECGEIFVIDMENPQIAGLTLQQIAGDQSCPNCSHYLKATLRKYPETFRTESGEFGSYIHSGPIPPDDESLIIECWEIELGLL